jgi:hypothetical protein
MKKLYMDQVEQFESLSEVMSHRLILRKYLRELFTNQAYSRQNHFAGNMVDDERAKVA